MQLISFLMPTCLLVVTAYDDYEDSRGGGRGGGRDIGDEHGRFGPPGGGSKPIRCYVVAEKGGKIVEGGNDQTMFCPNGQCMAWVLSDSVVGGHGMEEKAGKQCAIPGFSPMDTYGEKLEGVPKESIYFCEEDLCNSDFPSHLSYWEIVCIVVTTIILLICVCIGGCVYCCCKCCCKAKEDPNRQWRQQQQIQQQQPQPMTNNNIYGNKNQNNSNDNHGNTNNNNSNDVYGNTNNNNSNVYIDASASEEEEDNLNNGKSSFFNVWRRFFSAERGSGYKSANRKFGGETTKGVLAKFHEYRDEVDEEREKNKKTAEEMP